MNLSNRFLNSAESMLTMDLKRDALYKGLDQPQKSINAYVSMSVPLWMSHRSQRDLATSEMATTPRYPDSAEMIPGMPTARSCRSCLKKAESTFALGPLGFFCKTDGVR